MKVAVVGAGLAGLTAGWRLQQAGYEVEVLEADDHPGGRVWSVDAGGFQVDPGAHMFLESYDRLRALVDEMGLGDRWYALESPEEGGILHGEEVTSFSPRRAFDVLRYRGLSLRGRIRLFLALAEARRWSDELDFFDLSVGDDDLDQEDCRSFSVRRVGQEATDYVVDSFIRTFHFHGAHRMSRKYFEALAALLVTRGEFRPCALRGYMGVLPTAVASRLAVTYGSPVSRVTTRDGRVWVTGSGSERAFDCVVVATTANVAKRLLVQPTGAQGRVLAHADSSCTITCSFTVPVGVAGGFEGIWVPFVENRVISGLSNETSKGSTDGRSCVLTVWLHEATAAELLERPDQEILDLVSHELVELFPRYAGQLTALHIRRWPAAIPVYAPGQISRVRRFWEQGQGEGGVWLCGDYLNHPWAEGAVRCGEKVARRIAG